MSSFSDILKSSINNVKTNEEFDVDQWAKDKQAQKEWAYTTQDEMAERAMQNIEELKKYLDTQSKFDSYSVGNALLVTAQNPKATQLKDIEGWKRDKVYLKRNPQKIIILEPYEYIRDDGREATGYNPKVLYDISETQSKRRINTIPYTSENILRGVLSVAPVEVVPIEHETKSGKLVEFNIDKRRIDVNLSADDKQIVTGLINEIASINMMTFADTPLNDFKNKCATYMTCTKYGIPTKNIDISKIPEELKQLSAKEIKEELSQVASCFQMMKEGIDRTIDIEPKTKSHRQYER